MIIIVVKNKAPFRQGPYYSWRVIINDLPSFLIIKKKQKTLFWTPTHRSKQIKRAIDNAFAVITHYQVVFYCTA